MLTPEVYLHQTVHISNTAVKNTSNRILHLTPALGISYPTLSFGLDNPSLIPLQV